MTNGLHICVYVASSSVRVAVFCLGRFDPRSQSSNSRRRCESRCCHGHEAVHARAPCGRPGLSARQHRAGAPYTLPLQPPARGLRVSGGRLRGLQRGREDVHSARTGSYGSAATMPNEPSKALCSPPPDTASEQVATHTIRTRRT